MVKMEKKRDGAVSMDVSESKSVPVASPQAMDTSETGDAHLPAPARKMTNVRRGIPMKRTKKDARKMKALASAIELNEKYSDLIWANASKGNPMKKTKNARKMKAVAKAIALNDKYSEKAAKDLTKTQRTLSAKKLYD